MRDPHASKGYPERSGPATMAGQTNMAKQRHRVLGTAVLSAYGETRLPAQPNKSLIDGLACLQTLAMNGGPIGVRALARKMKLEPTRVHRLLKTLAFLGVAQQTDSGEYEPGPGMHVLSAQSLFGSGLFLRAIKPLEELHSRWAPCTVAMGVLWRLNVCYLFHASPHASTAEALGRLHVTPVTGSSMGMALLSASPEDHVRNLFAAEPIPDTTADELIERLRGVRLQGYGRVEVTHIAETSLGLRVGSAPNVGIALSAALGASDEPKAVADLRRTAGQIR